MTPELEEIIFATASNLTRGKERDEFLDHACRDEPEMRNRLNKMLDIQGAADTFFELQPEVRSEGKSSENSREESLGAHIGRYRLVKRIGAGGCGVVYQAEQEEPVPRKVALKIVKLGMDTEAIIARFALERQVLALMDHANIARVLDAGTTSAGRPYFVMELVEGERITDFCDANRMDIRRRLELFVLVCQAIQHAHQKGVIHRDIKPSNVLVTLHDGIPEPKVIDFGIAKATAGNKGSSTTSTALNHFLGTPAYMSPEQTKGGVDVDTRSDIYSLGVLLYELVSGRPPFELMRLKNCGMDEMLRILREEEPKPPSVAVRTSAAEESATIAANRGSTPQHLASVLAGDLDWIVTKAMEKERARRYDTVNWLAMDIRRYLIDEPVSARPRNRAYLLGKLVRRNRVVFAAGSIAVFGLLAGFGTSTWMFFRERAARQAEARLRQNAEYREQIAHAAVKIKYGDPAAADELLARVPIEQTPSSLEAAQAFGAVADWHLKAGRFKEASARFSSMVRALSSVDDSDLPSVSVNLLPVAATVIYSGEAERYEEVRRFAMDRFRSTTNPVVAEETLKACLLIPADKETLSSLTPLADIVKRAIDSKEGLIGNDPHYTGWACFALSLMHYRVGEYGEAAQWGERCLATPEANDARTASMLILRAMIQQKSGQSGIARASLTQGQSMVHNVFSNNDWTNLHGPVFWFDWMNASILATEAERSIESH